MVNPNAGLRLNSGWAMSSKMKRLILSIPLMFGLAACSPSFEGACKDFCDKSDECAALESGTDVTSCKNECEIFALTADQSLEAGLISQKCYDLATDLFSCAAGLSCTDVKAETVPKECENIAADIERSCA